jgi:1-aminocyclopropane-1-carboxylate deaminase
MSFNSPIQEIHPDHAEGIRVFLKRDDLLHPLIHGNKWRKIAPFLAAYHTPGTGVLSFGGAFSNHLHALASAGRHFDFPTIGIVRGLAADLQNPTLAHARACGMRVIPVPKLQYDTLKRLSLPHVLEVLQLQPLFPCLLLPEGGDTPEALVGCKAIAVEIREQLPENAGHPLYFCVPAGTGCTAAGVVAAAGFNEKVVVFPAAPYGVDQRAIFARVPGVETERFEIIQHLQPRKFAQMTEPLLQFIQAFENREKVRLDPIYTGKMLFNLQPMFEQQYFPKGSTVVAIHTGGLQGWDGMVERKLSE